MTEYDAVTKDFLKEALKTDDLDEFSWLELLMPGIRETKVKNKIDKG